MSVYHMHVCYLWRSEEDIGSSGTEVMNGCEPPCDLDAPEEQQVTSWDVFLGPVISNFLKEILDSSHWNIKTKLEWEGSALKFTDIKLNNYICIK